MRLTKVRCPVDSEGVRRVGAVRLAMVVLVGGCLMTGCGSTASRTTGAGTAETVSPEVSGVTARVAAFCADLRVATASTTTTESMAQILETPVTQSVAENLKAQATFAGEQ
jgi:hypothetical protein